MTYFKENIMSETRYILSKIDNQKYCKTNGQFTRHLRNNNLTYKEYFEKYVTGKTPLCKCGNPLTFYQNTETYANSCGRPSCVGANIKITKSNWTDDQKKADSENKKLSAALRTEEQIQNQIKKTKNTFVKKYGVEWGTQSEIQKNKSKKAKLEKYGNEYYSGWEKSAEKNRNKSTDEQNKINELRRQTNLERYGVENCFLRFDIRSKAMKSNSEGKDYILPSGKIIKIRGYEDTALSILLEIYQENEILTHNISEEFLLPTFQYINVNLHKSTYYPDIYIPKENRIIEVKSTWWWDGNGQEKYNSRLQNNLKKRQAVLDKGYNYEVWLFENKDAYKILKDDKDFQT